MKWADPPAVLAGNGNEFQRMRALDSAGKSVQVTTSALNGVTVNSGDVDRALATAAHAVSRHVRLADQHPHPDRPAVLRSPT